jgi:hypothetical protein
MDTVVIILAGLYKEHFRVMHTTSGQLIMCPRLVKNYVHTALGNVPEMDTVVSILAGLYKKISE